jgi:hypothetical protein
VLPLCVVQGYPPRPDSRRASAPMRWLGIHPLCPRRLAEWQDSDTEGSAVDGDRLPDRPWSGAFFVRERGEFWLLKAGTGEARAWRARKHARSLPQSLHHRSYRQ